MGVDLARVGGEGVETSKTHSKTKHSRNKYKGSAVKSTLTALPEDLVSSPSTRGRPAHNCV